MRNFATLILIAALLGTCLAYMYVFEGALVVMLMILLPISRWVILEAMDRYSNK